MVTTYNAELEAEEKLVQGEIRKRNHMELFTWRFLSLHKFILTR